MRVGPGKPAGNRVTEMISGPWEHRLVNAGGVAFHTAIQGDGPHTILLLHDFPEHWWSFRHQIPAFAEAGYRAVAMDLRGFGLSDNQPGPVALHRLATDALSVLNALGTQTCTVVGAGMGGSVAWALAHQRPTILRSMALMSAAHPLDTLHWSSQKHLRAWIEKPRLRRFHLQDGSLVRACLQDLSAPENAANMTQSADVYAETFRRKTSARAASETFQATIDKQDKHRFSPKVNVPVLFLRGDADSIIHQESSDISPHIDAPQVSKVIQGAGRYMAEEAPAAVSKALLTHCSEIL